MSDSSVSERRIRPILDAIDGGNWKQALQLCDKWAKKGEHSERFLAVKAFALVSQADKGQHDRGKQDVLDLCKRSPPITEPEAIYQLQKALRSLSLDEETPKLWERALTVKKEDKDLYTRWLNQAILDNNWRSAQKATMGMRNSFPKERHYEFWNTLMCYLIHKKEDVPEKERMLFGTLAYRMVSKAVETIPKDEQQTTLSLKAISDPEEIALLVQVLNSTGHVQVAVQLLHAGPVSLESRLGKQDPQLVVSLLLESLEASGDWDVALKICHELLSKPEYQSDNRIWSLWLRAHENSKGEGLQATSKDILHSVCNARPIVRPAYHAKLSRERNMQSQISQDNLLQTCRDYSEAFSEKAFCFDDLKESLKYLDPAHRAQFVEASEQRQGNLAQLFALKVLYSSSDLDNTNNDTASHDRKHLAFAYKALELYQKSLSGGGPSCPEAAVLAVLAILRTQNHETRHQRILFVITILEVTRAKFEDYYILTVLLVQLQAHLGLLSLALQYFTKLSVKNMQWETIGHLILTRISTLHPGFNGRAGAFDPLLGCETTVTVLEKADNALVRGIREGLRCNVYSNIYNSVKMRSEIERSMNKQICAVEERRIARWRGLEDHNVLPMVDTATTLVDKRDFSYLPSYREVDRRILELYRCGELPKRTWIDVMSLSDSMATYLKADLSSNTSLAATAYENLKKLHNHFSTNSADTSTLEKEMTQTEISRFEHARILSQALVLLHDGTTSNSSPANNKSLSDLLTDIKATLTLRLKDRHKTESTPSHANIAGTYIPTWLELHTSHTELESLALTSNFFTWLTKKQTTGRSSKASPLASLSKETISDLQTLASDLESQIHKDARTLKGQLNEPGVLGKLVDLGMARRMEGEKSKDAKNAVQGSEENKATSWIWNDPDSNSENWGALMESLCDEATMENICARYRESWDDALDGISTGVSSKGKGKTVK